MHAASFLRAGSRTLQLLRCCVRTAGVTHITVACTGVAADDPHLAKAVSKMAPLLPAHVRLQGARIAPDDFAPAVKAGGHEFTGSVESLPLWDAAPAASAALEATAAPVLPPPSPSQQPQQQQQPLLVLYDTHLSEEMFGWRVRARAGAGAYPPADWGGGSSGAVGVGVDSAPPPMAVPMPAMAVPLVEVLDTQDVHSLRAMRQAIVAAFLRRRLPHGAARPVDGSFMKPVPVPVPVTVPAPSQLNVPAPAAPTHPFSLDSALLRQVMTAPRDWMAGVGPELRPLATHLPGGRQQLLHGTRGWSREVASWLRCDATLLISPAERALLLGEGDDTDNGTGDGDRDATLPPQCSIARPALGASAPVVAPRLTVVPFLVEPSDVPAASCRRRTHAERAHMLALGTFRHAPNNDSVMVMHHLWAPLRAGIADLQRRLGQALPPPPASGAPQMHIHGSHCSHAWSQAYHDPASGFLVRGLLEDVSAMGRYRALLAPLRFGAGLKGKVVDALLHGTPVVTTPIGAEGFTGAAVRGAMLVADNDAAFVDAAARLYTNHDGLWDRLHASALAAADELVQESLQHEARVGDLLRQLTAGARARCTAGAGDEDASFTLPDPISSYVSREGIAASYWKSRFITAKQQARTMAAVATSGAPLA